MARTGSTAGWGKRVRPRRPIPCESAGASGRALRFDGAASVSLPESDALAVQTLSAETVVRAPASPGQFRYLISRGSHGCIAGSYGLYTAAAGGIALYVFDGTRYVVSATARPEDIWNGAWHHVAGTFDGHALRLFLDGQPVGEPMAAPLHIDYAQTSALTVFGQYAGGCELSFHGDMDLVRLWSGGAVAGGGRRGRRRLLGTPRPAGPRPAAAPGRVIPAGWTTRPTRRSRPPARACVVRLLRASTTAKRRTVIRVRVTVRHRPLRATRVVARHRAARRCSPRHGPTQRDARGLVLSSGRSRRVRISTQGRKRCGSVLRLPRRR